MSVVKSYFEGKVRSWVQQLLNCTSKGNFKFRISFKENFVNLLKLNQEFIKLVFDKRRYKILTIKSKYVQNKPRTEGKPDEDIYNKAKVQINPPKVEILILFLTMVL